MNTIDLLAPHLVALGGKVTNFAPPLVVDGNIRVSQSVAATAYLGEKFGFTEGVSIMAVAVQYCLDLHDFFSAFMQSDGMSVKEPAELKAWIEGAPLCIVMRATILLRPHCCDHTGDCSAAADVTCGSDARRGSSHLGGRPAGCQRALSSPPQRARARTGCNMPPVMAPFMPPVMAPPCVHRHSLPIISRDD